MKFKTYILLTAFFISFLAFSQNYKIGYVNLEKVFSEWPETKSANTELQEYETQLQTRLQAKVKDFQTKVANYNKNVDKLDALTKKDTETELQNLQTQIQQFEANAEQSIAEKNNTLLTPLQTKLKQAIDDVAKENGYTHIFTQNTSLIFTTDTSGDISNKVAAKLGFNLSN